MKKFLLQIILLSVLDFGTLGLIGIAPQIYVLLWLLVWVVFRVRGSDLFVQGLLLSSLIYILSSESHRLLALALWYIPLAVFLFFVRKQEKENFCPLFCLVAPFWMGIACMVTGYAGWTMDDMVLSRTVIVVAWLLMAICRAVCAGLLNWIWRKVISEKFG